MKLLAVYFVLLTRLALAADTAGSYPIVDTGQTQCYDNRREMDPPNQGQPFHGQDAQFQGRQPSYQLANDGLTVCDNVTGLTWQRSPDTNGDGALDATDKLTFAQAAALPAKLNAAKFGGFSDWRLPTIKDLYSLIVFSGLDPSGPAIENTARKPFIDTMYFKFAYGDVGRGERLIDSQWASRTRYAGTLGQRSEQLFGVNFADGRIKGYGLTMPGGMEKTFFVLCVRGNPRYGLNEFRDNADGTITDQATGLMWAKADSSKGMDWQAALAWAQARNVEKYLGYDDWRVPNAKELQSIVDYSRSPESTRSPAIDPVFRCTPITNEAGKSDYAFYWTSTTHASITGGGNAVYIAFGRATGWPTGMPPGGGPGSSRPAGSPNSSNAHYADVHGAGAQRSDPKTGDPASFPRGRGPQGDVIRILNYVRLVRGGLPG
jgi:hypothetical protein